MELLRLSDFKDKNFSKTIHKLYMLTSFNEEQYPGYFKWFYEKNVPRILAEQGDVLFALDGFMVKGLSILKKEPDEQKICTFYVDNPYRNQKVGSILLEESFSYLGTDKPVITIPEYKIKDFSSFIARQDWKEDACSNEYFKPEIIFNTK